MELLVVIAIIVVLGALAFLGMGRARDAAPLLRRGERPEPEPFEALAQLAQLRVHFVLAVF